MKKRIIAAVAVLSSILSIQLANAVAVSETVSTRNENQMTFSGKITDGAKNIMVKVYNSTYYSEDEKDGFVKLSALTVDDEGKFSFDFTIPETLPNGEKSTGEYTIVYADGAENKKETFAYANTEDAKNVFETLKAAGKDELYTKMQQSDFLLNAEGVGIECDTYLLLNDSQKQTALSWVTEAGDKTELSSFVNDFNICINLQYLISCEESERVYTASKLSLEYKDMNFELLSEEDKKFVADYMSQKTYTSQSQKDESFAGGVILAKINNARKDELTAIFSQNAELTGMGANAKYQSYCTMNESTKLKINEAFIVALNEKGGAAKTEDVVELFEAAYASVYSAPAGGGSSSGGGSSGGGGGSSPSYLPTVTQGVDAGLVPEEIKPLSDIDEAKWAKEAIEYCTKEKIVSGYEDGTFKPNNAIKREEFVIILLKATELFEAGHKSSFKDVEADSWYEPYVACAADLGIINGISADEFGTGGILTRQDMAVIVENTLKSVGKEIPEIREYADFTDQDQISDYAVSAVSNLYSKELVNGMEDGSFAPRASLTRAQAVRVIYDAFCK